MSSCTRQEQGDALRSELFHSELRPVEYAAGIFSRSLIADWRVCIPALDAGPGCSSMQGAMLEIGPAFVRGRGPNATLVENPGRWNEYAHVLFIDQPAGTGYR